MNDLARGIARDRERLSLAFESVLDSGYVVMGPNHNAFQDALASYLGVSHVLGVASGTDALELAIKAVMPNGRATVVTAANAGGYTSVAAKRAGYSVGYADIDPNSLCVSLETLKPFLTDDVGVVVVTHLYGNLTDIADLVVYCHDRGIRVVEDCAQAIGAMIDGKSAGSFGDIAATSFYPTKNLGAIGDGGAVFTADDTFAAVVMQLRQYGWSTKYHVAIPGGTNSRLDELQAAFLSARLPLLDGFNQRRRDIIARYCNAAKGGPLRVLPAVGTHHIGHLAVALTPNRDEVRAALAAFGIHTEVHFPIPDFDQPGFESDIQALPVTARISREIFSLPCFPELSADEVQQVCRAIESLR